MVRGLTVGTEVAPLSLIETTLQLGCVDSRTHEYMLRLEFVVEKYPKHEKPRVPSVLDYNHDLHE